MMGQKRKWLIAILLILLQFLIFKWVYPFASFFQDSYSYIYAAMERHTISYRPIGYSWFLILMHGIWASDTFLVFIQYALLQMAGVYLYFSLDRLYRPRKITGNILFFFLLLNPVNLYLANAVSSDALFTGLTLIWLTELLWLMHRPTWWRMLLQLVLLFLIFNIRYTALYYPVIAAAVFLMTRASLTYKLTGIIASVMTLTLGAMAVREMTWRQTGVRTFSAFSGWQMANNALYVYPYIEVDAGRLPSPECRELDSVVRTKIDRTNPPVDTWYMWDPHGPLKTYMRLRQRREHTDYFTAWNRVGPVFSQYGYYLLTRHPWLFWREYGSPSARIFLYPPLDVLSRYNEGESEVDETAKEWFHYNSTKVRTLWSPDLQSYILIPFLPFWLFLNFAGILAGIIFLLRGRAKFRGLYKDFQKGLLLAAVYLGVNAAFSIFAVPNVFRYQIGPLIWLFTYTFLACDLLLSEWSPGPAILKE
ncbi:MAG: hypothetical protein J0H74_24325 [Chitinophagaceae bacterium]|nr:hypothetical protein [Chitinophagaceae bacterium]